MRLAKNIAAGRSVRSVEDNLWGLVRTAHRQAIGERHRSCVRPRPVDGPLRVDAEKRGDDRWLKHLWTTSRRLSG